MKQPDRVNVPVRIPLSKNDVSIESLLGDTVALTPGSVVALEVWTTEARDPVEWTVQVCGFFVAVDRRDLPAICWFVRSREAPDNDNAAERE